MTTQIVTAAFRRSPSRHLLGAIQTGIQAIVTICVERATRKTLGAMSDHLLRDMGVRRDEMADFSKTVADQLAPEIKLRMALPL